MMLKNFGKLQRNFICYRISIENKYELNSKVPKDLKQSDHIMDRFIGPTQSEINEMLKTCNSTDLNGLVEMIVPEQILDRDALKDEDFPIGLSESGMLKHLLELSEKNTINKNYIGQGYYGTHVPPVIQRNLLENPGWYTAYTPYQAEIAQGRLESLCNYQTMVTEMTGMDISNASMLDEATSAAESMFLAFFFNESVKKTFFIDKDVFPQSIALCITKASYLDIQIIVGDIKTYNFKFIQDDLCGVLVQSPNNLGELHDYTQLFTKFNENVIRIIATDLLALTITKTPAEQGASICFGNTQRFGVPMGYGGPHSAFFASKDALKRRLPGRIIGISKDNHGNQAYRMALQTREQHIRREKATSNICTAQALLANMAAMYAVYHGPKGLQQIATRVNGLAQCFSRAAHDAGLQSVVPIGNFFDTVSLRVANSEAFQTYFFKNGINVRVVDAQTVTFSFDETHTLQDIEILVQHVFKFQGKKEPTDIVQYTQKSEQIHKSLQRSSTYLEHEIFNSLHSEHKLTRYLNYLQQKDISLVHSMISLGSCTMKLNPTSFMMPVGYRGFSMLHPYSPLECSQGYTELAFNLSKWLCTVTGFAGISLQPNSGASGEYAGLLCIRKYHLEMDAVRDICLIPTSAHGTNPASATLAGLKVVTVATKHGLIDMDDLQAKLKEHKKVLAAMMITYPSTHGVFESEIKTIIEMVHDHGGLVYMDGANMNAQSGLTSPGFLGADVCHLNLHKTFSIPHGGGGPGCGPIGVNQKLVPFLPKMHNEDQGQSVGQLAGARFGSASILPISYSYLGQLGREGVRKCTIVAMLSANYMMKCLENDYAILYQGQNDMCAHEFILDIRVLKAQTGISEEDIAKRLMDYGFHAPTMSFPVAGTLMIEPTESEDKNELDRFIDAMKQIRQEIHKVEKGIYDQVDNPLKNAPHTLAEITKDVWNHKYTRQEAAFPLPYVGERGKFWPSVGRIQNAYGDRNLVTKVPKKSNYQ